MSMFDYLDTRELSEPAEIDMSDVVEEPEESEELPEEEDIVEVSEEIEVEQSESDTDRKTAEQLADSWDEGVFEYQLSF